MSQNRATIPMAIFHLLLILKNLNNEILRNSTLVLIFFLYVLHNEKIRQEYVKNTNITFSSESVFLKINFKEQLKERGQMQILWCGKNILTHRNCKNEKAFHLKASLHSIIYYKNYQMQITAFPLRFGCEQVMLASSSFQHKKISTSP